MERNNESDYQRLDRALAAIRAADVQQEASPDLESAIVNAFRRHHESAPRKRRARLWQAAAIAASIAVAAAVVIAQRSGRQPPPTIAGDAAPAPKPRLEFIPLPYSPAFTPSEGGHVLRVSLPRSSLRTLGFPINEERAFERIQADVLLGNDGIARAIRVVH